MIAPRNANYRIRTNGFLTFWGAYCTHKSACAEQGRSWNDDTQEQYEGIIANRIIPNLSDHDCTPIQDYLQEDYLKAINEIEKAGKNNDPQNPTPFEEGTLDKYLHIIKTVVRVASEKESFDDVFAEELEKKSPKGQNRIKRMRRLWMTPKSLSPTQERRVANHLSFLLKKKGEGIALFLMYALGLRNEEACGVNFGYIRQMKDYPGCYYLTIPQTTQIHTNEPKAGGKSANTGRNIPLPSLVVRILFELREQRIPMLQKQTAPSVIDIDTVPIAYRKGNPFLRCGSDDVTREAKNMFIQLGMREKINELGEYLQQGFAAAIEEQVDVDELALIEKEPTAYLLRRNFATHLALLKLTESQISYIIGHEIQDPQTKRSDFLDERDLYAIKCKMDERPLLNDVQVTPVYTLQDNTTAKFERYSQEFIIPKNTTRVHISAVAKEPKDNLTVTVLLPHPSASIREEVSIRSDPYPLHFESTVDVRKAYHEAFISHKSNNAE